MIIASRPRLAAAGEQVAQLEQGGVGRDDVERTVARPERGVEAALELVDDVDAAGVEAGVLHPQRELRGARPGRREAPHAADQQLPVGIPHPGDVAAVGRAVVEHAEQVELAALERERPQHLVRPRRVLDEQDRRRAAEVERLGAAEGGRDGLQPGHDVVERHAERQRERGGAEGVVDVVEAGERQLDPPPLQRERGRADPAQLDVRGDDRRLRALLAAVRAAVVTEVGEVDRRVCVGVPAAAAVLGVRRVLELGQRERVVLHPEVRGRAKRW
jgi:hypothetical protein